jgi:hypothetical protein
MSDIDPAEFVLQDSRGNTGDRLMFWAKDGAGYTTSLDNAQRYTKEQATKQNESRESDLPWPLAYLEAHAEWSVDHQYVKPEEVAAELGEATKAHLYATGQWNGNDLIFLTGDGGLSDDVRKAEPFPVNFAIAKAAQPHNNVTAIAHLMAVRLSRKVVASNKVNHREALRGTGIMLAKAPRYRSRSRSSIQNCGGCGRFVPSPVYADCSHCGADNAP